MKLQPVRFRGLLVRLALLLAAYAILYQVIARTDIIQKVMASSFNWWEVAIIALFLVARILIYLLAVPALIATLVYSLARRLS